MNGQLQTRLTMLLAIAAACVVGRAEADVLAGPDVGPYLGAGAGLSSRYALSCDALTPCDRSPRLSGKVYVGYGFGPLGVEAMAFGTGAAQGQDGILRASGVALLGVLPLHAGDLTVKGKLGLAYSRGRTQEAAGGSRGGKSSAQAALGTSFAYAISKSVSVNADWDQLQVKTGSDGARTRLNMFSLGLSLHF